MVDTRSSYEKLIDYFEGASSKEKKVLGDVFKILDKEAEEGRSPDQVRQIPPIDEWLTSNYFIGSYAQNLYPYWREEIEDFISGGYNEWIITGSLGTGKSTAALLAVMRRLTELSCYTHPQHLFGLAGVSKIFFAYLSINRRQAELTGFGDLRAMVDDTQYFRSHYPRDREIDSVLRFANKVLFVPGSDSLDVIGTNLLGCILDETNFYRAGATAKGAPGSLDRALGIYRELTSRRESRFRQRGEDPGFSILISSTTHHSSFTETRIKKRDEKTKVTISKLWDVKPEGTYSNKKFFVFQGTDHDDPFIVKHPHDLMHLIQEEAIQDEVKVESAIVDYEGDELIGVIHPILPPGLQGQIHPIPEDFRKQFDEDIWSALKNVAGVSIAPAGKLFSSRSAWMKCISNVIRHPFRKETITVSLKKPGQVLDFLDEDYFFSLMEGMIYPTRHPTAARFIHIDQSESKDDTGIACVHKGGSLVEKDTGIAAPIIEVDFILRIEPPKKPDKISIAKIRKFLFDLRDRNVHLGQVTYDQYQSSDSIGILNTHGIDAAVQSLDRNDKPWLEFVNLIHEGRFRMYSCPLFESEFFDLEHDRVKHKVNHPSGGSKDLSDAVVGAVMSCLASSGHRAARYTKDMIDAIDLRSGYGQVYEELWVAPGYGISRSGQLRKLDGEELTRVPEDMREERE
jgi:hypothetical protein